MTGLAVFAISFAVLVMQLAPGLYLRDSGELTTAAFSLGVAHETGFSLWCLVGKAAALVPLGEVATRLNLVSAVAGATTAWLVYRIVRELGGRDAVGEVAGAAAAAVLLAGFTFFKASTVAEVYAPTAAAIALALHLFQRASGGNRRAGLLLALLGGLSLGLHAQLRILVGPPVALWALWRLRRGDRWPLHAPVAVALGAAVVFYLPLRAAHWPAPADDWADPRTLSAMLGHLGAARIRRAFADQILTADLHALAQHLQHLYGIVEGQLAVPVLLAAAGGLFWLLRRPERRALGLLLGFILVGDALYSAWVNPMGLEDLQDGAPTALVLALLCGVAVDGAARRFGRAGPWAAGALAVLLCIPAALADVDGKRGLAAEAGAWTGAALDGLPPRSLLFTTSDDLSAGVLYEQSAAGARPDVTALVRQQLWDGVLVAQRLRRGGSEVRDPWHGRPEHERIVHEDEILRGICKRELPLRHVAWEPAGDTPPVPPANVEVGAPLYGLGETAVPLPQARPLAARVEALLAPGRDPWVRRMTAQVLSALGRTYLDRGDDARAGALFETALSVRPADAVAETNLAVVRARRGDYQGAERLLEALLEREPERLVARINSGRYRLQLGDLEGAERQLEWARGRAPFDAAPLVGLSRVAERRGQHARALELAIRARRIAPADPEARAWEEELKK